MNVLRKAVGVTGWTALTGAITYSVWTGQNVVLPIPPTDYIFGNTLIARFNPNNSPVFHDVCLRKVRFENIRPELLDPQNEGKLVQAFCAGVWSGSGYAYQRSYLERKYKGPRTAHQLWSREELANSSYDVGTEITDHFHVVSKTPESIIVRCGDSPLKTETRESDGLFEMVVQTKQDEGVVEFGLKSVFFNGLAKEGTTEPPMGGFIAWLHKQYDKILMETAIRNCMK